MERKITGNKETIHRKTTEDKESVERKAAAYERPLYAVGEQERKAERVLE